MSGSDATPCHRLVRRLALLALFSMALPAGSQDDFVAQARAAKAKGQVEAAITLLEQGLAQDPGNASGHYVLAWLYLQEGQQDKAVGSFRKVVELAPNSTEGREATAALERLGRGAGAEPATPPPSPASAQPPSAPVLLGPRPSDKPPEITTDPKRMCLLINGEPFFPIGSCGIEPSQMTEAARAGFDVTVHWGAPGVLGAYFQRALARGDEEGRRYLWQYLDAAKASGLWVVEWPLLYAGSFGWDFQYANPSFPQNLATFLGGPLPRVIDLVKEHPALLAYYGPDEPTAPMHDLVRDYTAAIRARDPSHPAWVLFWGKVVSWSDVYDVVGVDNYPMPGHTPLFRLYVGTRANAEAAHALGRPYWHMPLMEVRNQGEPPLSPPEQRAQTYLALIAGANGLVWWYKLPRHVDNWRMVEQLVGEVRALAPVLTEPPAATNVTWSPRSLQNTVQARAIRHGAHTWLIAANACEAPATVRFTLPVAVGQARVWFEDRGLSVRGREFEDGFEGYGRHVYELDSQWGEEGEVGLEVRLGRVEAETPEFRQTDPLRPNLILDPGFESDLYWVFGPGRDRDAQARGSLDETAPRSGRRCALIELHGAKDWPRWQGAPIELKPNTRYAFGGYARTEPVGTTLAYIGPMAEGNAFGWVAGGRSEVASFGPWRQYSTVLTTDDAPVRVWPVCGFVDESQSGLAEGKAWFDDLFMVEMPPEVRNVVPNGGFETREVAPGWPGWWTSSYEGLTVPGHIGANRPLWGLDDTTAFEGRRSLRMAKETDDVSEAVAAENSLAVGAKLLKGHRYVLSLYMKGDRPGLSVQIRGGGHPFTQDVTVATEWRRYVLRADCQEDLSTPFVAVYLVGKGTLWVDAVQFEEGTEPTEYHELGG